MKRQTRLSSRRGASGYAVLGTVSQEEPAAGARTYLCEPLAAEHEARAQQDAAPGIFADAGHGRPRQGIGRHRPSARCVQWNSRTHPAAQLWSGFACRQCHDQTAREEQLDTTSARPLVAMLSGEPPLVFSISRWRLFTCWSWLACLYSYSEKAAQSRSQAPQPHPWQLAVPCWGALMLDTGPTGLAGHRSILPWRTAAEACTPAPQTMSAVA